jgi:hypothetical protein
MKLLAVVALRVLVGRFVSYVTVPRFYLVIPEV